MILDYLKEHLLAEARFDIAKPENYQFYGIDSIESEADDEGNAKTQLGCPYIFVFNERLYDMEISTTIKYPQIRSELGYIRYDELGALKLKPVYVDENEDEYDLTDVIIKSNDKVSAFLASVKDQLKTKVVLDFFFDISQDDPNYDPDKSFETMKSGSPADVFRKLNNVAFILKEFISKFGSIVGGTVTNKVFGNKYKMFSGHLSYYLTNVEFVGKEDFEGDMKRTNLYKKWFAFAGKELGTIESFDVDGIDFDIKYKDTRIA